MSRHGDVQEQLVVELYVRDFTIAGPDGLGLRFATRLPDLVASNAGEHALEREQNDEHVPFLGSNGRQP